MKMFFKKGDEVPFHWFDVTCKKTGWAVNPELIKIKFLRDGESYIENGVRKIFFYGEMPWIYIDLKTAFGVNMSYNPPAEFQEIVPWKNYHLEPHKLIKEL